MTDQSTLQRRMTLTVHCRLHCGKTGKTGDQHQWQQRLVRLWLQRIAEQIHFLVIRPRILTGKQTALGKSTWNSDAIAIFHISVNMRLQKILIFRRESNTLGTRGFFLASGEQNRPEAEASRPKADADAEHKLQLVTAQEKPMAPREGVKKMNFYILTYWACHETPCHPVMCRSDVPTTVWFSNLLLLLLLLSHSHGKIYTVCLLHELSELYIYYVSLS